MNYQLFFKIFAAYLMLFGVMMLIFDYAMGHSYDIKKIIAFVLISAFLSFRRARKMTQEAEKNADQEK